MLNLKAGAGRVDAGEPPLEARRDELATGRVGDGVLVHEFGKRGKVLVLVPEKVRLAKFGDEIAPLLGDIDVKPQPLAFAEEVAVLPERIGAEPLAGVVGKAAADRARRTLD